MRAYRPLHRGSQKPANRRGVLIGSGDIDSAAEDCEAAESCAESNKAHGSEGYLFA